MLAFLIAPFYIALNIYILIWLIRWLKACHGFFHKNIFEAVYCTNLLMRSADVLVTKPSELAFYPVPKLFIRRVGGHNGIKNIIAQLGTDTFQRIKVGVGEKPKGYDLAAYVLGHFHGEDLELMEEGYEKAISATEEILKGEIDAAMNEYNRKVKPKEE